MKDKRRRRLVEWGKTVLIILLTCSAVYLAALALTPGSSGFWPWSFSTGSGDAVSSPGQAPFSDDTLRPAALAVTWPEGRCAYLYDRADQDNYSQLSALLAEALSAAGAPQPVPQVAWQRALVSPGVYWEYLGELPLGDLSRWLAGMENPELAGYQGSRLLVSADALYFFSDTLGCPCAAPLSLDLSDSLSALWGSFTPNGARYAFQESHIDLRADTLLLPGSPSMPVLAADDPIAVTDGIPNAALSRILQVLSFHPQTNPLYDVPGGWAINDGSDTLRVTSAGAVHFRQSADGEVRFPTGSHPLDVTRSLAEQTVGALCGDARLSLRSCEETEDGLIVTYDYLYRGASIHLSGDNLCARFVLQNGAVTELTLTARHYTATQENSLLLPQEQAAAAYAGEKGWTMGLVYEDRLETAQLTPFWAADPA